MQPIKVVSLIAFFLCANIAQTEEVPLSRFEAGAGFSFLRTGQFGQVLDYPGVDGRFVFNVNPSLALDSVVSGYLSDFNRFNQINVQQGGRAFVAEFGLRVGVRQRRIGVFGFARPGFIRFSRVGELNSLATRPRTSFLTDLGGTLEVYPSGRVILFLEAGSPLIMFAQRTKPLGGGATAVAPGSLQGCLRISSGVKFRLGKLFDEVAVTAATGRAKRYELGVLFSSLSLQRFFDTLKHEPGVGFRGSYNPRNHWSFDAEIDYFPRNPRAVSAQEGGKMLLGAFGPKMGIRRRKAGFFVKARPGFIRYSQTLADNSVILSPRYSPLWHFALDAGGVLELYPSNPTVLRFDVGDTMIWYGSRKVPGFSSPFPGFSRDSLQVSVGLAFRF